MNKLNNCLYNTDHNDINHLIAKYIKKNINNISQMTIDELAKACYVSKGKISKFCKILGYENFIAFKDDCAKEVKTKKLIIENQRKNLDIEFQKYIHHSMSVIERNLCEINQLDLKKLVKDIAEASYIFLYGINYSNLLCQYMQYESDILGKDVIVLDENLNKNYNMKEKSLLIVISIDGHVYEDNQRIIRKLKKYPAKQWILTTSAVNQKLLIDFNNYLVIPTNETEVRERQLIVRYVIDLIMGRYQYLYI